MTGTRSCISARSERLLPASAAVRSERDALKAAIGAALSEFTLRPHTDVLANKMLHAAQMAAMRKLRRSVVTIGERQEWAVRVEPNF